MESLAQAVNEWVISTDSVDQLVDAGMGSQIRREAGCAGEFLAKGTATNPARFERLWR
jgi:hypothetical protein